MVPSQTSSSTLETTRYDELPYPLLAANLKFEPNRKALFKNSLITSRYLRERRFSDTSTQSHRILDFGCGTGAKTLVLAEANPEAEIIGVDFSPKSIEIARDRQRFHQETNVRFEVASFDQIHKRFGFFDFINADEVLYLLPDPLQGLQALASTLKTDGIMRVNFHHVHQRQAYFRAQSFCSMLGLVALPQQRAIPLVREILKALRPEVDLKRRTCHEASTMSDETVAMNFLLKDDKGYNSGQIFDMLGACGLEMIRMTNPARWNLRNLFTVPESHLALYGIRLAAMSEPHKLQLYELLNPVNRLMDLWCGFQDSNASDINCIPVKLNLHPALRDAEFRILLTQARDRGEPLDLTQVLGSLTDEPLLIYPSLIELFLSLFEGPVLYADWSTQWNRQASEPSHSDNRALLLALAPFERNAVVLFDRSGTCPTLEHSSANSKE